MQSPEDFRGRKNLPTSLSSNRNEYENQKHSRNERFQKLQKEREQILQERQRLLSRIKHEGVELPPSRLSELSLNAAVNRARESIPEFEDKVRAIKDRENKRKAQLAKPYKGELGIGSYEPWQLEDFYFVRDFVRSWAYEVVDFIVFEPIGAAKETIASFAVEFQKELESEQLELEFLEGIREVQKSITEEVTEELVNGVTEECVSVHFQVQQVVSDIILDAVMPSDVDDATKNQISNAYQQMRKEQTKRPRVWQHSQKLYFVGDEKTEKPKMAEEEAFDGIVLSMNGIIPYDETPNNELSSNFRAFRNAESNYWMNYTSLLTSLPLPRRYKGVSCTALSSDHSLLVVGSEQGDIAVWDLMLYPPRVLRASRGAAAIKHIQWSLDSSQILSLNSHGVIQLWSLGNTLVSSYDIKGFEPVEQNIGFKCSDLVNVLTLEARDLKFTEGSFKSVSQLISKPTFVAFHPSLTFLCRQESIMVGMANGTILKLNLSNDSTVVAFPKVPPNNDIPNKVGKGIEAELFKSHKHPIKLIEFINDGASMLTVDDAGFIYIWEYSEDSLSGFGWFTPSSSYQLDMAEVTYHPADGTTERVEFVDTVKGTGRIKDVNRQDMIKKRKQMQTVINSQHFGKPWKSEDVGTDKVTCYFAPRSVPESGATFHCVTYYKGTKILARYTTQLYKPGRVPCTKLLSCQVNPSGNKLVFSLLFKEVPPKEPHAIFVTIDLKSMKVSKNLIEFPLNDTEYKQCEEGDCCGFGVSKVIDATGSEYVMTNVCGSVNGFSGTTGSTVVASSQDNWVGCHLNDKQSLTFANARVKVACPVSGLIVLFYSPKQNMLNMLHLKDKNKEPQRRRIWTTFCNLKALETRASQATCSQVLQRKQWTVTGIPDTHIECTVETLLLDLVDEAIQTVEGQFTDEEAEAYRLENRQYPFVRCT